jgi:hypothetical protein
MLFKDITAVYGELRLNRRVLLSCDTENIEIKF